MTGSPTGRLLRSILILLTALTSACLVPHFRHLEHVTDVQRVLIGGTTRDEVRKSLGEPGMVDTPGLYVYDWEKAKSLAIGSLSGMAPIGHTGTRALFVFDSEGRIARAEVRGIGQGHGGSNEGESVLPIAAAAPPPSERCADKHAVRAWFAGPEPRLIVHFPDGIRICDARGSKEIGQLPGKFISLAISADGRMAATYERDRSLTLRDGSTFEPLRTLEPPSSVGMSLLRWGLGLSFSADGRRLAASLGNHGVSVYDTTSGEAILRLADRWSPRLSPDGLLIVSKSHSGFTLTELDTGRDVAVRPLPKYPYGIAPDPYLARRLLVDLGATAFSADGRRLAIATCAHAEVWDVGALLSSGWEKGLEDAFLLPFTGAFGVCAAAVRFSSDAASLAVANEGTVTVYGLVEHKIDGTYALPAPTAEVSFTPDLSGAALLLPAGALLWEVGKVLPPAPEQPTPEPEAITYPPAG